MPTFWVDSILAKQVVNRMDFSPTAASGEVLPLGSRYLQGLPQSVPYHVWQGREELCLRQVDEPG